MENDRIDNCLPIKPNPPRERDGRQSVLNEFKMVGLPEGKVIFLIKDLEYDQIIRALI